MSRISQAEVNRSTAAVTDLLNEAITAVQNIQDARGILRGVSARPDEWYNQLDTLLTTLWLIRDEPELQTLAVQDQSKRIVNLAKDLQQQVDNINIEMDRDRQRHEITRGREEVKNLENAMTELERARTELTVRICLAPVGVRGMMGSGFSADAHVIQRVDGSVHKILKARLAIAYQLEARGGLADAHGRIPITNEEALVLGIFEKISWMENETFDYSAMFQSDLFQRSPSHPVERNFGKNKAHGRSLLMQGHNEPEGVAVVIRAHKEGSG